MKLPKLTNTQDQPRICQCRLVRLAVLLPLLFLCAVTANVSGQTKRVVIIKVDGLPHDTVDRFVRERDPRTGKSLLPWFDYVFYQNGTRVANFYVRGITLSGPSWSEIDTGQHLQIKGNAEFDRAIAFTYDYLNILPYYAKQFVQWDVDMPGTEVLDSLGIRLLMDAYDDNARLPSHQIYQRGARLRTFQRAGQERFLKHPKQLFDDLSLGLDMRNLVTDELERELIEKLQDPRIRYFDLMTGSFDHMAHATNDRDSHLAALQEIDGIVGRVWTAIQKSEMGPETTLVLVSDHGINSDERVYSQGFNLVKLLGRSDGGGHHVVTRRRPLLDYSIKGVYPFAQLITTTTSQSYYLKGQSTDYPTALLDFDGNERAGLHLRNNKLNVLQVLFQQLQRKKISPQLRSALTDSFFSTLGESRRRWLDQIDQLDEELLALRRAIEKQRVLVKLQPKKFTAEDREMGRDDQARRVATQLRQWIELEQRYSAYVHIMRNLLTLERATFDPSRIRIEDIIPKRSMGANNTIYDLQNYVVGLAPVGLVLRSDGSLDLEHSFLRVNYFQLFQNQSVRNNVQDGVSNHPIDFTAVRVPRDSIAPALSEDLKPADDAVWIYGGPDRQALILARGESEGRLMLRYLPIANLSQDADGKVHFEQIDWKPGLPLRMFEDSALNIPGGSREAWLSGWHSDTEWLRALHRTQYSNGLIGLHEELTNFPSPGIDSSTSGLTDDERLLARFRVRQRRLVETDLFIEANDHWNFDLRGFNPGGNHGSFLRISTHSTLMFAGGKNTGIMRGALVEEPYDNLSVTPTILALTGNLKNDNEPTEELAKRGFRKFPGRVIVEIAGKDFNPRSTTTAAASH